MPVGHDDTAIPAVAGHHDQVAEQLQRLGGDGEVDGAVGRHFGDLHRRALVHVQGDVRVLLDEAADHVGQRIARLGVGSGDGQRALLLVGEFLGDLLDALDLAQDLAGGMDDPLPAGVTRVRCLPLRANTSTPSSSSSRRICLLMPGCEV